MKDFIPASHPASLEHPSSWTLSARHYVGERHPLISLIYLGLALGSFLMGAHLHMGTQVLLREVILRFRKGIETQRLLGVSVEDDDYAKITAGMSKCSNYAHDKAMIGGVAVPEPDELLADIQALDEWRATVVKRSEETVKKRKAGPVPV